MPSIRPYEQRDWEAFLALDQETGLTSLRGASESDREAFRSRWPGDLQGRITPFQAGPSEQGTLYILDDDGGDFAGHLWLVRKVDPLTGATQLWVSSVAIVARHRSRGWGRLLMAHALEEAKRHGASSVGLHVDADNVVARKLYEEMGFETRRLQMIRPVGG